MSDLTDLRFDLAPPTEDQRRDLESDLSDEERHVLLEHGTEAPFCGVFVNEKRSGNYAWSAWQSRSRGSGCNAGALVRRIAITN